MPVVRGGEVVECWPGAPGAGGIRLDGGLVVQQRGGDFPEAFETHAHAGTNAHADAHAHAHTLTWGAVGNTSVIAHWRAAHPPAPGAPTTSAAARWCGPSTRGWRSADISARALMR